MKKMYLMVFLTVAAFSLKTQAANWTVNVKDDLFEDPASFTPQVGDSITWVWMGAHDHTVTSTAVPATAAPLASPQQNTGVYGYKITVAGPYSYFCAVHGVSMSGSFTATNPGTGIQQMQLKMVSSAFPNPFSSNITISSANADMIVITNSMGQQIHAKQVSAIQGSTEFDFSGNPAGVYYYSIMKQGAILERKAIVKTN